MMKRSISKHQRQGLLFCIFFSMASIWLGIPTYAEVDIVREKVDVTSNPEYKQTTYRVPASDGRYIKLMTYQTDLNRGVLSFRTQSDASLEEHIEALSVLFKSVLENEPDNPPKTLFIGGLEGAFGRRNNRMSRRLATAAYYSDQWDRQKGRPYKGHVNNFVMALANEQQIFVELHSMFAKIGYAVKVSGIEKVFIRSLNMQPFASDLMARGLDGSARLPYDGLTWFSIRKL